jgi:hypothetical protein
VIGVPRKERRREGSAEVGWNGVQNSLITKDDIVTHA